MWKFFNLRVSISWKMLSFLFALCSWNSGSWRSDSEISKESWIERTLDISVHTVDYLRERNQTIFNDYSCSAEGLATPIMLVLSHCLTLRAILGTLASLDRVTWPLLGNLSIILLSSTPLSRVALESSSMQLLFAAHRAVLEELPNLWHDNLPQQRSDFDSARF